MTPSYTLGHLLRKDENVCSHKKLYVNIQSSFTHNSPNWKQPKCLSAGEGLSRWWWVVHHPYHGILLSGKREWAIDSWTNQIIVWSVKANPQRSQTIWFHLYGLLEVSNYRHRGQVNCLLLETRNRVTLGYHGLYQESQDLFNPI